jgi:fatty acid desaturase
VPIPRRPSVNRRNIRQEPPLIILGVILLIIGFVAKVAIIWTIGIIVVVVGAILALLGTVGHAVGGRRHYY